MQRLPIDLTVEYRGAKPASRFLKKETGEMVDVPGKLRFELQRDDGDVENVEVSAAALDRVMFDYSRLQRGEFVHLQGDVVIQDRGSDRDSYFAVRAAKVLGAATKAGTKAALSKVA